jgi:hypothetical protein
MGALPQVLGIIFEVQRKMNNEKIIRREIIFSTYKIRFFFSLVGPLLLSNHKQSSSPLHPLPSTLFLFILFYKEEKPFFS